MKTVETKTLGDRSAAAKLASNADGIYPTSALGGFPWARPRRLRRGAVMRELVAETKLCASMLMTPYFVTEAAQGQEPIPSMPEQYRYSIDALLKQVEADMALGLRAALLFGVVAPASKDAVGQGGQAQEGLIPRAVRALRKQFGDALLIATDVCLCGYTNHGHCGLLSDEGMVQNDASLPHLAAMACAHADAGADMVAPSDMMDGRIVALRRALDEAGHGDVALMAYSAKYASAYYGPFRDAADSAPQKGDRHGYQMDVRNGAEAVREAALDVQEGADIVMVKPALAYLDVVAALRKASPVPVACYNVSGEYALVKAGADKGWIDEGAMVREHLISMARAGAQIIITYHGRKALEMGWLD